jgi:hypothetical protein
LRRYYIVSVILLIVPIALAALVLVQEKRQASVDLVHISEDAITMLGKRGNDEWLKYLSQFENHFAKPEESSAARPSSSSPPSGPDHGWTDVERPPPSIPEKLLPVSSLAYEPLTESEYELVEEEDAPPGPSRPASSTMSNADHESVPSTGFDSDHWLMAEEPPSRPPSSTESDADHEYQVVDPPPPSTGSASPVESDDDEMVDVPPSSPVQGNAKESRRIFGASRDVLNAAQRELQHEVA